MNASGMEFLNFDTNDEDLGIYHDNFSQILLNVNDSGNEATPRYTHTFGVRIFLLAGNITGGSLGFYNEGNCVDICY